MFLCMNDERDVKIILEVFHREIHNIGSEENNGCLRKREGEEWGKIPLAAEPEAGNDNF